MTPRRILVVDDDPQMVKTLCDILSLNGWQAEGAQSGEAAVERVKTDGHPVVLMDIKMEGMNGVDALEAIRAARAGTQVILMTAYSTGELVKRAESAGAVTVLAKPVALVELLRLVAEVAADAAPPVLLVDDDPSFLRTLGDGLREAGVAVRTASTLRDAIETLERDDYRVVLLDLRLETLSGTDCALAVKRASPDVLLVLLSGYPEILQETADALPPGWVAATLTKPFEPTVLLDVLERVHAR